MKSLVVSLALTFPAVSLFAGPPSPTITLIYTTAETSSSAEVVWNTSIASDSLLQYSVASPVPANASSIYLASPVKVHDVELTGLNPGTLYYYRVTSCAKRRCATATGSFDTYPSCPDEVPAVSGSWQREASPNVGGFTTLMNQLLAVAAISDTDVWAVGWSQQPGAPPYVRRTLIERFDGAAWRIVPSPNPGADTFSVLQAVSGTSATDAWAVGVTHNGTLPSRTLIQRWNGTAWSIVPSPNPGLQLNELRGVVALSPSNAWAVGFREGSSGTGPTLETLILHWDGVQWAQVETPSVGSGANQLFGIGAISANDLWAVGSAGGAPLALRWRGTGWSVVDVARDAGLSQEFLTSVSGASGDDVWAVGQGRGIFSNQVFGTIRHWDGVHWTEKTCYAHSASNPPENYEGGGPTAYFTGVSARSGNDVWAVGVRGSGPMILHWDGTAWTPVVHPRAFPNSASLRGVAALGGGSAWSVGGEILVDPSGAASPERTLIDRYSP